MRGGALVATAVGPGHGFGGPLMAVPIACRAGYHRRLFSPWFPFSVQGLLVEPWEKAKTRARTAIRDAANMRVGMAAGSH